MKETVVAADLLGLEAVVDGYLKERGIVERRVTHEPGDAVIYFSIAPMIFFNSAKSALRISSPRLEARLTPVGPR